MTEKKAGEVLKHQLACEKEDDCVCGGYCEECQHNISDEDWIAALNVAISALEKQEKDRWIPVTERLPDKSRYYLVTNDIEKWGDKITETCEAFYVDSDPIYKTSYWCGSENHKLGKVLAWRPLPEAYKEEEES